jgi:cyclic beta-1,2-glucan synthetase
MSIADTPAGDQKNPSQLKDRARRLAQGHRATRRRGAEPTPLDRLDREGDILRQAYLRLAQLSEEQIALSRVAEWLLDNFYVVQQSIRQIRENMPGGYYLRLPKLDTSPLTGYPRIYAVAQAVLELTEGHLDIDRMTRFIRAYQEVTPLTMGELWAVPTMLRLSVVELLAGTVARAVDGEITFDEATPTALKLLEENDDTAIVASCIHSLRFLENQDWDAFFESVSLVEETLRRDPAGTYARMDFDTRDRYREVVETLALGTETNEEDVASEAIELAQEAQEWAQEEDGETPRASHVGYYLIGQGRDVLQDTLDYGPSALESMKRWVFGHSMLVYVSGVALLMAGVLASLLAYGYNTTDQAGGLTGKLVAVFLLGLLPGSIVAINVVNAFITHTVPPRLLPKLDFSSGIPLEYRTAVVVPCLLSDEEGINFLLQQIELHYLRNSDPELGFALLTDFSDAPEKRMPEDDALLEQAQAGIERLNRLYGQGAEEGPFHLLHRYRQWNASEECWMGWERKRGKLVEFNRLVRGSDGTSYHVQVGNLHFLSQVKYVITLDADTVLPMGSAHRLVSTLAHPLNQAQLDPEGPRVVAGYTVLQPRTEVKPTSATQTPFTRLFAGDAGLDLYTRAVSDVYQEFFGEGIFVGKGIYDVDAFERSLDGRVPENALLSHDLFEGIHGRAALVTDIVLFEDYPPGYLSYEHRKHRWVRGDWQLLPWLLPRVPRANEGTMPNDLSALDGWKILDNLRRSLRAPALLALLIVGWLWLPGSPLVWTSVALLSSGIPLVGGAITEVARRVGGASPTRDARSVQIEAKRWLLSLVFLPYESLLMIDAIATTLVRLTISRKRLLQWTTAAHTVRVFGRPSKIGLLWRRMGGAPALAVLFGVVVGLLRPRVLPTAAPLLLAWLISPQVANWISRPVRREQPALSANQRKQLRRLARRTWLYFERFVGPDDHWLPPDHFQEDPRGVVAHRTSPTNIGLLLLSALSAHDLGHIGLLELALRVRDTLESMDQLERYRGHFFNWYNTSNLNTLTPRYVSTVDSGNLAACLLALRQGLQGLQRRRILSWRRWEGLCDALGVLTETVEQTRHHEVVEEAAAALEEHVSHICRRVSAAREEAERWVPLLLDLAGESHEELHRRLTALIDAGSGILDTATLRDLRLWSQRVHHHLGAMSDEVERMLPWQLVLRQAPTLLAEESEVAIHSDIAEAWGELREALPIDPRLEQMSEICRTGRARLGNLQGMLSKRIDDADEKMEPELVKRLEQAHDWCDELDEALESARLCAGSLRIGLGELIRQAKRYFEAMDFSFLFDHQREVFRLGYHVDAEQVDENHYDLLASEARIASIVAIGKGHVPERHWLHLSRPLTEVEGSCALLSWNGSMFEYLMPDLMIRNYEETLLDQTRRAAVRYQIAYAGERDVPWGISESGYYRFDAQRNYQYRGFGVPGLGRKRGLEDDLVITPYASLLALPISPQEVVENIALLVAEDALGHYGLYEAVDYTPSRLPLGEQSAVVRSYMAHHQGMIMASLTNYLADEAIVKYFHADPLVRSVELLLQEQAPSRAPVERTPEASVAVGRPAEKHIELKPWSVPEDTPLPQVHFLSNGRYGLLISRAGGGQSSFAATRSGEGKTVALTRWRADTTLENWGMWIYVQDRDSGWIWSATEQPTGARPDEQLVRFYAHQAEFRRRDGDISLHTEITVAPEEDVEIRCITLTNHGDDPRHLRMTSYGEVVLAPQATDRRHPAFSKLFIESEYLPETNALLFRRRPRSGQETPLFIAHTLITEEEMDVTGDHETDRARFLGRGGTIREPAALSTASNPIPNDGRDNQRWLSGTVGATLDPIMALGQEIDLEPHATARLAYVTLAAESREEAVALTERYQAWPRIERAFDQARSQSQVELRNLDLETGDVKQIQQLLSTLLYPHRALRAAPETLRANRRGQSGLWPYSISGDYPILLVRIDDKEDIPLVRQLLRAHAYWRHRRIKIDLVILNERDVGYAQELGDQLNQMITQMDSDAWLNRRGGIFLLNAGQMDEAAVMLLKTAARAVLDAGTGTLADQLDGLLRRPTRLPAFVATGIEGKPKATPPLRRPDDLQFDNGFGGFGPDGREYVVYLETCPEPTACADVRRGKGPVTHTPAPWINVIANPDFGFLVSEMSLGYTWASNSGENRLTPWRNDPVSDQPSEALYLRDEETGEIWSPTPLPAGADRPYLIRHGAGYSSFEHHSHGLKQRLRVFAPPDAPVKVIQLRLKNVWERNRRLTATFYAEWVLGSQRDDTQLYIVPEYDGESAALLARNTYSDDFGEREGREAAVAFVASTREPHGLTADRAEFLERKGSLRHPAALDRVGLASRVEPGIDPCAAMQVHVELAPGEMEEITFLLGQGADREEALTLVETYRDPEQVEAAWQGVNKFWDGILDTVTVDTPEPAMDLLLNRWLLYQALSCRVWGRSALYQSSGAFGFRDQLQDVMSLLCAAPHVARQHILRCACHQFEEGDVLHWWHPTSFRETCPDQSRGVRTRISDDLLWLPYVTAQYVKSTGDDSILEERLPFRTGQPLGQDEAERYGHYALARERASDDAPRSLYEHCRRALDKGATAGPHGLPLMGAGDWNDGLNRVGVKGRGESVWLGWFLYATLIDFAPLCERMEDGEQAKTYRQQAAALQKSLQESAWDGSWYRRAYYDDGTPLGSAENRECRVASMAQSWAVLSGAGDEKRSEQAMEAVADELVREEDRLLLLFTPPFDKTPRDPGYIKGYPPGIRENGGQYTHAALWAVWAYAELGQGDRAGELFRLLNSILHSETREKARRYCVEPYVVAADVYSAEQHLGHGGWTWYTGSSGWMYRLGVEAILGLRKAGKTLHVDPCIPGDWPGYRITYRYGETVYDIKVENPEGVNQGVERITLDGEDQRDGRVPLTDDGLWHEIHVLMGSS